MTRYPITTGMQTVTAAGPVTGTLSTATLTHLSTLYLDVTGLTSGTCRISIEDSATGTFGDALPPTPCGQWKEQLALLQRSSDLITRLRNLPGFTPADKALLDSIEQFDNTRKKTIADRIGLHCSH